MNLNRCEINRFKAKTDPNKALTCGVTWAKSLRLKIRSKEQILEKISQFSTGFYVREEERERESIKAFFRRSLEFRTSEFVEPRTKVHRLNEGYTCVPKTRSFTKDPKEEIWGNQSFRVKEVLLTLSTFSTILQKEGFFLL